jgi:hypothetical protein
MVFSCFSEMSKPLHALSSVSLPTPEELLPNKDPSAVAELRNQIFLSQYLAENASRIASSPVFGQPDLRDIQSMLAVLLRGTASEALYNGLWGPKLPLGAFRGVPIQVRSHPLAIFPVSEAFQVLHQLCLL